MVLGMVIGGFALLTLVFALVRLLPRAQIGADRQRLEGEVRQAHWRLQQATTQAIAQLLAEGRRQP